MRDADSHRERIVDQLMRGETVAKVRLHAVLEESLILGDELAIVFSARDSEDEAERFSDLRTKCRKLVARYVNQNMDDEVRDRIDADESERRAA